MDGWTDYQTSVVLLNDTLGGRGVCPKQIQPYQPRTTRPDCELSDSNDRPSGQAAGGFQDISFSD
jgi:hypothetical protein